MNEKQKWKRKRKTKKVNEKKFKRKSQTKIPTKFRRRIVPGSTPIVFKLRKLCRMLFLRSKR